MTSTKPKNATCALAILLAAFCLGGCASLRPTDPYRPVALPPGIAAPAASQPTQATPWLDSKPIRLEEAVELSLENNPELAAAGYDARAAEARPAAAPRPPRADH